MKAKNKRMIIYILKINPTALMFKNNQILYIRFQCTDVYGCPKLLDMQIPKSTIQLISVAEGKSELSVEFSDLTDGQMNTNNYW